jgi:hypothetical protein
MFSHPRNKLSQTTMPIKMGGSLKAEGFGDGEILEAIPKLRLRLPPNDK